MLQRSADIKVPGALGRRQIKHCVRQGEADVPAKTAHLFSSLIRLHMKQKLQPQQRHTIA